MFGTLLCYVTFMEGAVCVCDYKYINPPPPQLSQGCSLHLAQRWSQLLNVQLRRATILSKESAPGLIMATGGSRHGNGEGRLPQQRARLIAAAPRAAPRLLWGCAHDHGPSVGGFTCQARAIAHPGNEWDGICKVTESITLHVI